MADEIQCPFCRSDIDPEAIDKLCESDQAARGIRIQADAVNTTTKAGNPFTKVNWIAVTDD